MQLNNRSWHVRFFFFTLAVSDEFFNRGDNSWRYEDGTNLCHFVRTICFYLPLTILAHLLVVALAVWSFIGYPIHLFTARWYLTVLAVIGGLILAVFTAKKLARAYRLHRSAAVVERIIESRAEGREWSYRAVKAKTPRGPSTWSIIWAWVVSAKKRICPEVQFLKTEAGS